MQIREHARIETDGGDHSAHTIQIPKKKNDILNTVFHTGKARNSGDGENFGQPQNSQ